ncbi:DUF6456 domain-containing protein [Tateyamaria sp. ANG-S1]|uniref:DUF6456 domain-containing protein n=1 Tax=Tateyamaria sp. ANG-S1 TaxID=1577905 RepID=UPI00057F5A67|nr:DUF6456 domain-containing protein [Tateyamaria sp. ANG-S1]KIC48691.1 hypothetical protein RA29_13390 [Tateyamaria sp. ANG-S1]
MRNSNAFCATDLNLPAWVPDAAVHYLAHTEAGLPIRELARKSGCHASTVLRQIRRFETRRDDPLVDAVLRKLGASVGRARSSADHRPKKDDADMQTAFALDHDTPPETAAMTQDMVRILRRLCETGAVLAVAVDMQKAVVVRDGVTGSSTRTAVVDRKVAEAMALQDWIAADQTGRITRYKITPAGRTALADMMGEVEQEQPGFAEAATPFADQHRQWGERTIRDTDTGQPRKVRYNLAESPLTALARRRDKGGQPFLSDDLVTAGERLREDFELAQMGPRVAQNWDRFLTGGGRGSFAMDSGVGNGPEGARNRVAAALRDLGPGLSDVVLRCCCYLEGLESAEKQLGWSARSGKIVLRIALMRLKQHYDETTGPGGGMIG